MNQVHLAGKISRVGSLQYSPSGMAILEFTMAVPGRAYGRESVGYYEVVLTGKEAEDSQHSLKIGLTVSIEGSLHHRVYRNRNGIKVNEIKVIFEKFGGAK